MRGCGRSQRTFKIKRPQAGALKIKPCPPGLGLPFSLVLALCPSSSPHWVSCWPPRASASPEHRPRACLLRSCCPELGQGSQTAGRTWDGGQKSAVGRERERPPHGKKKQVQGEMGGRAERKMTARIERKVGREKGKRFTQKGGNNNNNKKQRDT